MGKTEGGTAPSEASYPNVFRDKMVPMDPTTIVTCANLYHKALRIAIRCRNHQENQGLIG